MTKIEQIKRQIAILNKELKIEEAKEELKAMKQNKPKANEPEDL